MKNICMTSLAGQANICSESPDKREPGLWGLQKVTKKELFLKIEGWKAHQKMKSIIVETSPRGVLFGF
jgi:hypothetical protein